MDEIKEKYSQEYLIENPPFGGGNNDKFEDWLIRRLYRAEQGLESLYETEKTPYQSGWYVCCVNGNRMILKYNVHNNFWVDFAGKTYKPTEIDKWLNDK